ncbi:duf967 domain protein [Phlyctema vagabunda]|uniref:Duf967 domain protein n=1 Tax=Phlyctema vagabunda TaxID=108571 RepID=A0ABR4PHE2_9HELO
MSSSSLCGLRLKPSRRRTNSLIHFAVEHALTPMSTQSSYDSDIDYSRRSLNLDWAPAREDQLSVIVEVLDAETRKTPGNDLDEWTWPYPPPPAPPPSRVSHLKAHSGALQKVDENSLGFPLPPNISAFPIVSRERFTSSPTTAKPLPKQRRITQAGERPALVRREAAGLGSSMEFRGDSSTRLGKTRDRKNSIETPMPVTPTSSRGGGGVGGGGGGGRELATPNSISTPIRPFEVPPRDLDVLTRIDNALIFEQFTTNDAWTLGSALRQRLMPLPSPAVINISLANANQVLFHASTHPGIMPDSASWVARTRNTVLRWGVSSWYMSCKFAGDERAFANRYGLGERVAEYAIAGGGVPIRVRGVEGVVAVVVVNGLQEDENHAVIVECIKELYY